MDLDQLSTPREFRRALLIQTAAGLRPLDEAADEWQRADFAALDNGWRAVCGLPPGPGPTYRRCWRERPRGHSKSSDAAVEICFALVAAQERINGVVAAGDEDQAAICRDAIDRLVRNNDWLSAILRVDRRRVHNVITGSECAIIASDVATSFGLLVEFAYLDEIVHWRGRELFDSILSAAAKRPNCLLLCSTNAGWIDHWSWPLREAIRQDADWLFQRIDSPRASWISPTELAAQRRLLPTAVYSRLWENVWCATSGDGVEAQQIERAVTLPGPSATIDEGWAAVAGLDIGLKHDATSIAVCARHVGHWQPAPAKEKPAVPTWLEAMRDLHPDDYRADADDVADAGTYLPGSDAVRLIATRHLVPRSGAAIQVEQIEEEILDLHRRFGLSVLFVDPWQGQYLIERLRRAGINVVAIDATPANLKAQAQCVLDSFREGTVQLYRDDVLLRDLAALRIREMSGGGFRLFANRGEGATRHADAASAFQLALLASRRLDNFRPAVANNGQPLICYP